MIPTRVLTESQVIAAFGNPRLHVREDGTMKPSWEMEILQRIDLPKALPLAWDHAIAVTHIRCHRKIAPWLDLALQAAAAAPGVWSTINDYGGCYEWRKQRRSPRVLSRHCWAIAIDLDVGDNPFGATPKVHPELRRLFGEHGFAWGGSFPLRRRDGMHFEFADLSKLGAA
jgi:hypothetical protein